MNKNGFTLIELLAVITILGILMLVAIPNITRTIENSRKDTFVDIAQAYIDAVRIAVSNDDLECCKGTNCSEEGAVWGKISSCPAEYNYFVNLDTRESGKWRQQTKDLMESGGNSSWGNSELMGAVHIIKTDGQNQAKYTYGISLADFIGHGVINVDDHNITRSNVRTSGGEPGTYGYNDNYYICRLVK